MHSSLRILIWAQRPIARAAETSVRPVRHDQLATMIKKKTMTTMTTTTTMTTQVMTAMLLKRVWPMAVGHWRRRATEWFAPWDNETLMTLTESDSLPNAAAR